MVGMNYSVYCCPYCLKCVTKDPELPPELRCTCFPLHGQYLHVELEGLAGTILVDSDLINQMRPGE